MGRGRKEERGLRRDIPFRNIHFTLLINSLNLLLLRLFLQRMIIKLLKPLTLMFSPLPFFLVLVEYFFPDCIILENISNELEMKGRKSKG